MPALDITEHAAAAGSDTQKTPEDTRNHLPIKIIIVIILLVLGGIVSIVAYHAFRPLNTVESPVVQEPQPAVSPMPSDMSDWKMYSNEEHGFEVKYPGNWHELDTSRLTYSNTICFGEHPGEPVNNFPQLCVEFDPTIQTGNASRPYSNEPDAQQQFLNELKQALDSQSPLSGRENLQVVTMSNISGFESVEYIQAVTGEGTEPAYVVNFAISHPEYGLVMVSIYSATYDSFKQYEDISRRILSTFRFLEEEETTLINKASLITGSIVINHKYESAIDVALTAESSTGTVTDMRIWTDVTENNMWEKFTDLRLVPWQGPEEYIYVQFRDTKGNVSEIYSASLFPEYSPPLE